MKSWRWAAAVLVLLLGASCQGPQPTQEPEPLPSQPEESLEFFRDGYFQAILPTWEQSQELDADSILMMYKNGQFIVINRYDRTPEIVTKQFLAAMESDPQTYLVRQAELNGKPFFEYTTREDGQTMRVQAVLDYCQGHTYALAAGGRDTLENAGLFTEVLTSSSCQDPFQVPDLDTGKIGLMVNTSGEDPLESFYPALRLAKENGVQVLHTYLQWGDVEPTPGERNWDWQDALMGYRVREGFEISLVVNVIHTGVRGPIPADLQNSAFDDPEFIDRFSEFILEVLDRYPIQYLGIGNEVNDYFISHRDEIPAYAAFFTAVRDRIHEAHPDVKVGMTFAFHDAVSSHSIDIIQQLDLGDFLPVTLYIYSPGFRFDRSPSELEGYLDRILDLAGDKPIALVETGWNTSEALSGNQEDQAAYLREVFRLLRQHRDQIAYISWFALYDSRLEDSRTAALTFLPPGAPQAEDESFMGKFVDFLNYFGLRESDGSPKQAWFAFQEESAAYLESFAEGKR